MLGDPHDVAIVGGSFSGLTAALQLRRASRQTILVDAGGPRNRHAPAAHGVAGWEGLPPDKVLDRFRADVAANSTVKAAAGTVTRAGREQDPVTGETEVGARITSRRIVLAHWVRDRRPDVPSTVESWGKLILLCPHCNGSEVRGRPLAVLATHPRSALQAQLLRADWSEIVTLLTTGMDGIDSGASAEAGMQVHTRGVAAVRPEADGLCVVLSDDAKMRTAALYIGPSAEISDSPAEDLEGAISNGPMGAYFAVEPMAETSGPGVLAAGDLLRPMPNMNFALTDGTIAGVGSHQSLVFPGFSEPVFQQAAA